MEEAEQKKDAEQEKPTRSKTPRVLGGLSVWPQEIVVRAGQLSQGRFEALGGKAPYAFVSHGILAVSGDGDYAVQPARDHLGQHLVRLEVQDADGATGEAEIRLQVVR